MTQGSPTSLSRHRPAAEANTALRLPPQLHHCPESPQQHPDQTHAPEEGLRQPTQDLYSDFSLCFKPNFDSTHGGQPCLRCCHTARAKWAATGRTARSARCPLAAGCRTQAPFSPPRRRRDHQSLDRSAEPSEVKTRKNGRTTTLMRYSPSHLNKNNNNNKKTNKNQNCAAKWRMNTFWFMIDLWR